MYRFDDFLVDPEAWRLSRDGQEIHLEPLVLELLIYLIANRERLVTRQELMDTVWGDTVISESALTKAVARLRQALGDDSATHRYLETVRSRGYRFIAAVEEIERSDQSRGPLRGRRAAVLTGTVALVLFIVLWPFATQYESMQDRAIRSLAVLPLNNLTGDPEQDYFSDGLQDLLITEISRLPGLRVTSRQSTRRYRDSQLPAAEIAKELGVDALLEGSLLKADSTIELTVQLIDGRNDRHLWAERYTREAPYVFNLVADAARAIGTEIGAAAETPGVERPANDPLGPVDPRAIDAFALGLMHRDRFTSDGISFAIEQFETAVSIEPKFALAWGELSASHAMQALFGFSQPRESIERTRVTALKAIEADGLLSIGHAGLGWSRMWTGDFDAGCASFEEAIRLNPSGPYAIHGVADCLMFEGRIDENLARLRELLTISPFSAMHSMPLPSHLYMARRFDEAVAVATAMQARVPQFSMQWFLAKVYWQQGNFEHALEADRLELEQRGDKVLLAALEEGLNAAGPTGAMRAVAEALVARADEVYVDPYDIGETFARAGMADEALYWLGKAVEHGSYETTYLAFWPHLDVVRDDPRYQDLLVRVYGARAEEISRAANSIPDYQSFSGQLIGDAGGQGRFASSRSFAKFGVFSRSHGAPQKQETGTSIRPRYP